MKAAPKRATPTTRGAAKAAVKKGAMKASSTRKAALTQTSASGGTSKAKAHPLFAMPFARVYPLYVAKAKKKGRTKDAVDKVISWLTGYTAKQLQAHVDKGTSFLSFFGGAKLNPRRNKITGKVCGVDVSTVLDPMMREIRRLDKLVDELAQGKPLTDILER